MILEHGLFLKDANGMLVRLRKKQDTSQGPSELVFEL